jgi:hypothetical protein
MQLTGSSIAPTRRMIQAGLVALSVALPLASWAATCPENITTCLGSASEFQIVGARVFLLQGRWIYDDGVSFRLGSVVGGSVCATTAKVKGGSFLPTAISGDLILLAESGTAVRFVAGRVQGAKQARVNIEGDLITAGGSVQDPQWAIVDGVVDTSGSHPKLDLCRQAMVDAAQASSVLGNLPATEDLGSVTVLPLDDLELAFTGTGAQVKSAVSIRLMSSESSLRFDIADTVDCAIVNVERSVSVGRVAAVSAIIGTFGQGKVLNLPGGGKVTALGFGDILATTVAPQGRIKATLGQTCELYGRDVLLKGAEATRTCLPPASPSGAFVDISGTVLD